MRKQITQKNENQLKKCPFRSCRTFFFSTKDLEAHIKTHWKPSSNGKGEWIYAEDNPYLMNLLITVGKMIRDGYRYTLINNKIIYRVKIPAASY